MILLYTDFGLKDPYLGQVHAAILSVNPDARIIDLFHGSPQFSARVAAYLLPAFTRAVAPPFVCMAIVDPGVGSDRGALIVRIGSRVYVGPDNGLFNQLLKENKDAEVSRIRWEPVQLSVSFHARDLFAPVASKLDCGGSVDEEPMDKAQLVSPDWPLDVSEVLYIDHYGNLMTGIREAVLPADIAAVRTRGKVIGKARTFSAVKQGALFWYINSQGLVEIAANRSSAAILTGASVGDLVQIIDENGREMPLKSFRDGEKIQN